MLERHYTYYLIADDPYWKMLMDEGFPVLYAGLRTCRCKPEDDPYMGSSEYVKAAMAAGIGFSKVVIKVHKTRKRAAQHEMEVLKQLKHDTDPAVWDLFFNRNVPGDFSKGTRRFRVLRSIAKRGGWKVNGVRANRKGGPSPDYNPTQGHRANLASSGRDYWGDMKAFAAYHGLSGIGKGGKNIDREAFRSWRASLV